MKYSTVEKHIQRLLQTTPPSSTVLNDVVDVLYDEFEHYSWVGIYLVEEQMLTLGPWRGEHATEHNRIPLGTGICGSAAQTGTTEVIDDVSKDGRYLSCFLSTRSEIVVPIKKNNQVIGEIDIDSDDPAAFDHHDAMFLEKIADMLAQHI